MLPKNNSVLKFYAKRDITVLAKKIAARVQQENIPVSIDESFVIGILKTISTCSTIHEWAYGRGQSAASCHPSIRTEIYNFEVIRRMNPNPVPVTDANFAKLIPPENCSNRQRWFKGLELFTSYPPHANLKMRKQWNFALSFLLFYGTRDGKTIRPIKDPTKRANAIIEWHCQNPGAFQSSKEMEKLFVDVRRQCSWRKKKKGNQQAGNIRREDEALEKLIPALKTFSKIPSRRELAEAAGVDRKTVNKHFAMLTE